MRLKDLRTENKVINLFGFITPETASIVASELRDADGFEKVFLNINSQGGDVNAGFSILSEITILQGKGTEVVALVVGIAYSMAAIIALKCNRVKAAPSAIFMFHPPSRMDKSEVEFSDLDKRIIQLYQDSLSSVVKSKKLPKDLLSSETYYSQKEALELGIADEPLETATIFNETELLIYNMNTQTQTENQHTALQEQVNALKIENESLKKSLQEREKIFAIDLINQNLERGKIVAADPETYFENVAKNIVNAGGIETLKKFFEAIPEPQKSTDTPTAASIINSTAKEEIWKSGWTYDMYLEQAPQELELIQEKHPKLFNQKLNEYVNG